MKEKKLELKKTIEMIKQNTYERKTRRNTIPEALISHIEKVIKEEPIQGMERSETRPKNKYTNEKLQIPMNRAGIPNARHWENVATTAERKDISHGYADKTTNAKNAM